MTMEEAIEVLKEISTTLKSWSGFTSYPQAIDMAISALSADGDLISRETLLKKAEKANITKYSTNSVNIITTDVVTVENIKKAPSAEKLQPRVETSDLISRADAIEAICNAQCELDVPHYPQCDQVKYCDEIKALLALPSAEAVQGEWIWRTDIPIGDGRTTSGYICSNCGKDYWHGNVFDFCPDCGARMYKGGDNK